MFIVLKLAERLDHKPNVHVSDDEGNGSAWGELANSTQKGPAQAGI